MGILDKNTLQKVYLQQSEENDDFNCLCQKFFMLLFLILVSTKNVSCFMCLFLKYFKRRNIPKMAQKMFHETQCFMCHFCNVSCKWRWALTEIVLRVPDPVLLHFYETIFSKILKFSITTINFLFNTRQSNIF